MAGTYSVTHVRNSEIKQLSTLFFPLCFEILTWYLVCGCIMISYRSSLRFVAVQWILAELWPLDLKFGQIFSCHHFFSLCFIILTWFLVYECIMEKLAYSKNIWWCTITRYNSGPLKVRCLKIKLDQYYINLNVITKKMVKSHFRNLW